MRTFFVYHEAPPSGRRIAAQFMAHSDSDAVTLANRFIIESRFLSGRVEVVNDMGVVLAERCSLPRWAGNTNNNNNQQEE
jgi:hypothetical protein